MAKANNPDHADDDGSIGLPKMDAGMNKIAPPKSDKAKKRKKRRKIKDVRDANATPALSENTDDNIEEQNEDDNAPATVNGGAKSDPGIASTTKQEKPEGEEEDEDEESDEDILGRIRKRFERCVGWEAENRKAALEDLKFKAGDQWPADVATQRNTDRRPCMTVNKIPTFIHQVTNDQRQNRPSIDVSPIGDKGDPEAAKLYRGMIRAIERECQADIAYDTAFDSAVSSGEGFWRILTEFEPDSVDEQCIVIKRIRNRFTVYLDPGAQEPEGADARFGFITELLPRDQYEQEYPDADPMPFSPQGVGEGYKDWIAKNEVRIAEYFELRTKARTLVKLDNGWTGYEHELSDEVKQRIKSKRIIVEKEREVQVPIWYWYKVNAREVLERNVWMGKWLPIIRVVGNEIDIEGKVRYSGLIRDSKDAQRIYNFAVTAQIEIVALQPKAPYIVAEGQIEGHEQQWKQANTKNYPYLEYKPDTVAGKPVPPPQRSPPPAPSAGWMELRMGAAQDMMATTGVRFDPTNAENRVDDSGRAIREMRRSSDVGNFHYVDNLARALKHCGTQLVDLIPKIYDGRRIATILREDDAEERIMIDPDAESAFKEAKDPRTGKTVKIFNPSMGKYACTVTIGPSYATKRIEAAESMMAFAKALPNTAALISDLIAKNQDWPGAEVIADRLAKTIPPNLLAPDMKDVPPQVQAVMQHMDQQIKTLNQQLQQAVAALNDKGADRQVAMTKIENDFEAKILAIMQKADEGIQKHIGSHIQNLASDVKAMTAELAAAKEKPKKDEGE
jgi:hypothetical protein